MGFHLVVCIVFAPFAKFSDVDVMRERASLVCFFILLWSCIFLAGKQPVRVYSFVVYDDMNAANIRKKKLQLNNAVIATSFSIR